MRLRYSHWQASFFLLFVSLGVWLLVIDIIPDTAVVLQPYGLEHTGDCKTCRISPSPMPRWQQAHAAVLLLLLVQVRQAKQRVFLFFDPSVAFVECMVITDLLASLWKDFHLFAYRGLTSSSYAAKEISLCYSFKTLPVRKQCIQLGCIYSRVTLSSPVYLKKWSHQV